MPKVIVDQESTSLQERFALIRTTRRNRQRYPEACVEIASDAEQALAGEDPGRNLFAALVYGPSVSSESQRIYYLVRWLRPE